jgi:dTDP-4-amino-4,6-dideoxygalactose transaminase
MIPFNSPALVGTENEAISQSLQTGVIAGDGPFSQKCQEWFRDELGCSLALLTPSCTHSLEMAALLLDLKPGDEVIMPSYTFVSTANAFALRGGKVVFVDIRPDTMNIDETLIEDAVSSRTRAIVPVHYGGVACDMEAICAIAKKSDLVVIEDAAQCFMATYRGRALGTIGEIGAFSFHETKNITSAGEGGLTILNDPNFAMRAEVIREKGTDRSQFFRGQVDKYSWVDIGSSYLMNDVSAAYLWAQIQGRQQIYERRMRIHDSYREALEPLVEEGRIDVQRHPQETSHNAHMYYIKLEDLAQRSRFIGFMKARDILTPFHYVPLHSAQAGQTFGRFHGQDRHTTRESERLVRLPLYFNMTDDQQAQVIEAVQDFFRSETD